MFELFEAILRRTKMINLLVFWIAVRRLVVVEVLERQRKADNICRGQYA